MPLGKEFNIPKGMKPQEVADTFAAYLLGSLAFKNEGHGKDNQNLYGPFLKRDETDRWQLDHTNDYFLHIEGDKGWVSARYPAQEMVVYIIVTLFNARYGDKRREVTVS